VSKNHILIIGAGPAGLTAAFEILEKTNAIPIIVEATNVIGGISQTAEYKGNRIDIGGHRFFSKSDRIMEFWERFFPHESPEITPEKTDILMLIRSRVSRIFYLRKFFSYPISLSFTTLKNLGFFNSIGIFFSFLSAQLFPRTTEKSLEDFFINRFGKNLYHTFFKDYTEKVWGKPCTELSAEWGSQRIKGLSLFTVLWNAITKIIPSPFKKTDSVAQKNTETSLIERFLYPKFGPGQFWEHLALEIEQRGGKIFMNESVTTINNEGHIISSIVTTNAKTGKETVHEGSHLISSMPIKDLFLAFSNAPEDMVHLADTLEYRDFFTVGVLLKKLSLAEAKHIPDHWIYIQEKDVQVGRIQIFNNWSPYLVQDSSKVWIGLEYFANIGDALWKKSDEELKQLASEELEKMGFAKKEDIEDSCIIRVPKAYPVYFGKGYESFSVLRGYLDGIPNLFCVGRNGMHRYNNQDHSMLSAMAAVENIASGRNNKDNIWQVNAENEYHEEK